MLIPDSISPMYQQIWNKHGQSQSGSLTFNLSHLDLDEMDHPQQESIHDVISVFSTRLLTSDIGDDKIVLFHDYVL